MKGCYMGKAVSPGIAVGRIAVYRKQEQNVRRYHTENVKQEIERLDEAVRTAVRQVAELWEKAKKEAGEAGAAIFGAHQMMLQDEDYQEAVKNMIRTKKVNAEYAVAAAADHFSEMFSSMDDDYMKERAADVKDISERLVQILSGREETGPGRQEPVILLAEDLSPSETVRLDKSRLLGFVTRRGSANSHTAILARTMGVPALVGVDYEAGLEGKEGIVDGRTGMFFAEPEKEILEKYQKLKKEEEEKRELLKELKNKETVTKSGKRIRLYANVGNLDDVAAALQNGAEGIGLFRSEFLYLERTDYPSEEEQFQIYKKAAERMAGKMVIIRTLDVGADKQIGYFGLEKEENPAMGYRAIRICLDRPELFRTQLRALYRASAYGSLAIMYPMITSVSEVREIRRIARQVKEELEREQIPAGNPEQGLMIETPAAALISDKLAQEADFFSIGTNDLTQYTLAADRQNQKLERFYDPHHEAVLKLIEMTAQNAKKAGIWAGICGELGADTSLTETFIKMGIEELSVSPSYLLKVRRAVRETAV